MPDGGSYRVEVIADACEGDRRLIEIRLRDNGPGLAPATWARLAAGDAPASSHESRGLGLGIVVELVAAMDGRILCASHPDRGTLFSIHLPAAER
jgi:C4-dicarboxylate-specific signal transduction histidine kinase